ncbi:lactonase family protein [Roseococcus sp. YIM B11640]|uniref:lactonase family protein n=1 Tax=Roseococcus sp. YIM B11640 TaxID=3133973 RepID=UPI003C7EAC76
MHRTILAAAALLWAAPVPCPAQAQIALSANDNKQVWENGVVRTLPNPPADTVNILDLGATPPRIVATVQAPHSIVGPPSSVALTPDGGLGLVASSNRVDPANPTRVVPDNRVSVIDLRASPPAVVQTVEAGLGPSGVSVNRAGNLALVANRNAGTVSVFRIANGRLEPVSTLTVGPPASGVSHVQFTPDGRFALVTRDADFMVSVLKVEGEQVTAAGRDITVGIRPYSFGITPDGRWAVVGNVGRLSGDSDTASLISLTSEPFRAVDTITVGATPEGVQVSPDNRHVAVTLINGSTRPEGHPLRGRGQVVMLRIEDGRLQRVAQADIGTWAQGVAFSSDGSRVFVQNMVEREIQVLSFDGQRLATIDRLRVDGGPTAIRTP